MRVPYVLLPTAILLAAAPALASSGPMLQTNHSCYLVGTPVSLSGSGFAPYRQYEVALDGVNFGVGTTDPSGGFTATLRPGGLGANVVQRVDTLRASDGVRAVTRNFTLTRAPGARILAGTGSARSFRAPFQVWGFTLGRVPPAPYDIAHSRQSVFVHYLSPTAALGPASRWASPAASAATCRPSRDASSPSSPAGASGRSRWTPSPTTCPVPRDRGPGSP